MVVSLENNVFSTESIINIIPLGGDLTYGFSFSVILLGGYRISVNKSGKEIFLFENPGIRDIMGGPTEYWNCPYRKTYEEKAFEQIRKMYIELMKLWKRSEEKILIIKP